MGYGIYCAYSDHQLVWRLWQERSHRIPDTPLMDGADIWAQDNLDTALSPRRCGLGTRLSTRPITMSLLFKEYHSHSSCLILPMSISPPLSQALDKDPPLQSELGKCYLSHCKIFTSEQSLGTCLLKPWRYLTHATGLCKRGQVYTHKISYLINSRHMLYSYFSLIPSPPCFVCVHYTSEHAVTCRVVGST